MRLAKEPNHIRAVSPNADGHCRRIPYRRRCLKQSWSLSHIEGLEGPRFTPDGDVGELAWRGSFARVN